MDNLSKNEQSSQIASAFRWVELLSFSPALKYTLGQAENLLNFREIIDSGRIVLYNLQHIRDHGARKLLGCLITIGYEEAALSRPLSARTQHHLVIDEMAEFVSKSEEALVRILSETRKYQLFVTMAPSDLGAVGETLAGSPPERWGGDVPSAGTGGRGSDGQVAGGDRSHVRQAGGGHP